MSLASTSRRPLRSRIGWITPVVVIVAATMFPFVVDRPRFWIPNIGITSIWLGIIAMSIVFLNRYIGLISLAQMTLAGLSGYGVGYMTVTLGQSVLLGALVGIVVGTLSGFVMALIAARTRAIYFLMITLALGQVAFSWASQAIEVTNARRGLAPIIRPDLGFVDLSNLHTFYLVSLALAVLCYALCRYVAYTPFGLSLQGIRDAPERMRALGYNVFRYRVAATTFAAFIASLGGVVLVFDRSQIDPGVLSLASTLDVLVVAVIGGIGSLGGVFLGAIVLTLLDNFAQSVTERYLTLTGLVFISVLLFAPAGLAGIGAQVTRAIGRLRRSHQTDEAPEAPPEPSTEELVEDATEKGSQQ